MGWDNVQELGCTEGISFAKTRFALNGVIVHKFTELQHSDPTPIKELLRKLYCLCAQELDRILTQRVKLVALAISPVHRVSVIET